jgi:hypothetical protein
MKKKKTKDESSFNFMKGKNREEAKTQGFYDGRFMPRIIKDRKKHLSKTHSRKWRLKREDLE